MIRRFNEDFVGAAPTHMSKHETVLEPSQILLDAQRRKLIGNNPDPPA
jgi:hypothetical protein